MRNVGGPVAVASIAIVLAIAVNGSAEQGRQAVQTPGARQLAATRDAFETDGFLGQRQVVLVRPRVESDTSVSLRARQAGLSPGSLQAKVYGLKLDVLFKDAEIGTAFMRRAQVYHLGSRNDQIVVDETYYYCDGFLSTDIVKITEKRWSKYYAAGAGSIAKLDTLAEAVRNGAGHQDTFNALDPVGGGLLGSGGEEQNRFEREVTWFAGRQVIETIGIELTRSPGVGNRVSVRFVQ